MRGAIAIVWCLLAVAAPTVNSDPLAPSVRVGGCGGTIIRQAGGRLWGISAGHCAKAGDPVVVRFSDGSTETGKWLHIAPETDLAAFVVAFSTDKRVKVAQIAAQGVKGDYRAAGSRGTITLVRNGHKAMKSTGGKTYQRTHYAVKSGKFRDGDSGVGVWVGKYLVGVASHGEDDEELYACRSDQLREFAARLSAVADLPSWGDKDRTREIVALKRRLAELEGRPTVTGPAGPAGHAGPAGPAGPSGSPGSSGPAGLSADLSPLTIRVHELEKWRSGFRAVIRVTVVLKEDADDDQP